MTTNPATTRIRACSPAPAPHRSAGLRVSAAFTFALGAALLAACGSGGSDDGVDDGVLTIDAADFSFDGVPDRVPLGTRLAMENRSDVEVHEAVVFRVPESSDAVPLDELMASAESDPLALGEYVGVVVALPGETGLEPEGPVTLDEPGRYVIACFVPTGASAAAYAAAIEAGAPPQVEGGLPHLAHGMVTELRVDD